MTDNTGDYWFYDVTVYPKNQSNDPTLDKLVFEDGTFHDAPSVSEGDTLNWIFRFQETANPEFWKPSFRRFGNRDSGKT